MQPAKATKSNRINAKRTSRTIGERSTRRRSEYSEVPIQEYREDEDEVIRQTSVSAALNQLLRSTFGPTTSSSSVSNLTANVPLRSLPLIDSSSPFSQLYCQCKHHIFAGGRLQTTDPSGPNNPPTATSPTHLTASPAAKTHTQ